MKVYYMNGAGNDFMVLDARGLSMDFSRVARQLCALNRADGFMAVDSSDKADFRLHFYNADGSRGEMCGNGARCICRYAYDTGLAGEAMTVETDAGLVRGFRLDENSYRVRLNNPSVLDLRRKPDAAYVELGCPGVPHAVVEYQGDLWADDDLLREPMHRLRYDTAFPKGANVNFYQTLAENEVRILTFERGVEDFTEACGTGTASVALVMYLRDELPGGTLTAHNHGGTLKVNIAENGIWLEGPTEIVRVYEMDEEDLGY